MKLVYIKSWTENKIIIIESMGNLLQTTKSRRGKTKKSIRDVGLR